MYKLTKLRYYSFLEVGVLGSLMDQMVLANDFLSDLSVLLKEFHCLHVEKIGQLNCFFLVECHGEIGCLNSEVLSFLTMLLALQVEGWLKLLNRLYEIFDFITSFFSNVVPLMFVLLSLISCDFGFLSNELTSFLSFRFCFCFFYFLHFLWLIHKDSIFVVLVFGVDIFPIIDSACFTVKTTHGPIFALRIWKGRWNAWAFFRSI